MKWSKRKKLSEAELSSEPAGRAAALEFCPVKNSEVIEEKLDTGEVLLTYPLILRPWFLNLATRLGLRSKEPLTRKLQLDEMGSLTWTFLDGKRSVQDLVDLVCNKYSLNQREAEIALTQFIRELGRRGLIGLRSPEQEEAKKST